MPPLIQLPRTKLSKNFAQFLLRSSGKSGLFFFLFFPFFLLRRGGNTGELCQSCQRRDANAVLRPTTANCGIAASMEMEKNRQFLDRTINERPFISNACSMLVRSFESLEFSRNSSTIPLDCRCFRFFLSFRYTFSLFSSLPPLSFRCVLSSLDAFFFRNFDNSRSLCRTLFELNYKTIDPRATLTYQDCDTRAISLFDNFFYTIPARSASKFFDFHHFALTFGNSKPKVLPFSCLSPIFSNSLTLHCDVLWMTFTIRKKKKFLLRQFQIAILPKKKKKKFSTLLDTSSL